MLTVDECLRACGYLGISRMGAFKEGRPCYKGGTGVCNQNIRKPGSGASRICKGIKYKSVFELGGGIYEYNERFISNINVLHSEPRYATDKY